MKTMSLNQFGTVRSIAITMVLLMVVFGVPFVGAQEAGDAPAPDAPQEETPEPENDTLVAGAQITQEASVTNLSVTCEADPNPAAVNAEVTWTANATGGTGEYWYTWTGEPNFPGPQHTDGKKKVKQTYANPGEKNATVTVTSGGQEASADCSVQIKNDVGTPDAPLVVSCSASPNPAAPNAEVTWTANATGGNGEYDYSWTGEPNFPGPQHTDGKKVVTQTYANGGTKNATVTIISGTQTESASCSVKIEEGAVTPPITPTTPEECRAQRRENLDVHFDVEGVVGNATVKNTSTDCTYDITLLSYSVFGVNPDGTPDPAQQTLFDYVFGVIAPGETKILTVDMPSCRWQIDLVLDHDAPEHPGFGAPLWRGVAGHLNTSLANCSVPQCPLKPTVTSVPPIVNSVAPGTQYSYTVTTSGGVQPVSIVITPINAAPGLTINGATLSGTLTTPGNYSYSVKVKSANSADSCAISQTITLSVVQQTVQCPAQPSITSSASAPQGTVNIPYSFTVTTSGGVPPVAVVISPIMTGAPGLSINGATISGTPTQAGVFQYNVKAYSTSGAQSCGPTQTLTLTIVGEPGPLCIPPTGLSPSGALPEGTTQVTLSWNPVPGAISYNIRLDDGTSDRHDVVAYTTCANSPHYLCENGLTVTSVPNIPVTAGRTYSFWIDPNFAPGRNYCNAGVTFRIPTSEVSCPTQPSITSNPPTVTDVDTGTNYNYTVTTSGGTNPVIEISAVNAAPGLNVNGATLSGTLTTEGNFSYQVKVRSAGSPLSCAVTQSIPMSVDNDGSGDDDDECTSNCGGGGGGGRRRPNVVLFSEPEILGASISLTQVPYTGLGSSIFQIILFALGLAAISGGLVYFFMRRRTSRGAVVVEVPRNATTTIDMNIPEDDALMSYEEYTQARPAPVYRAPAPVFEAPRRAEAPVNLPAQDASPVPAFTAHAVEARSSQPAPRISSMIPAQRPLVSATRIQNEARASRTLVSEDGARLIAASADGDEKVALERLSQVVEIAKTRFPREDNWLVLDVNRVREALFVSILGMVPIFIEWTVRGEDKKIFTFLRMLKHQEQPVADFMRKVVAELDATHRARLEGAEERTRVDAHVTEVTYHLSNSDLERIVSELLQGVDERYDSAYTSVRLSLVRVLDFMKERSLKMVGAPYEFAQENVR